MKRLAFLLSGAVLLWASVVRAQVSAPPPAVSSFMRGVLVSGDAGTARSSLGIATSNYTYNANQLESPGNSLQIKGGAVVTNLVAAGTLVASNAVGTFTGNGAGLTLGSWVLTSTNNYIPPALALEPLPNIYTLSQYGSNVLTESLFTNYINCIYTNGYQNFGHNYYQFDAGWAIRDENGVIHLNTNAWGGWAHDGKWACDYAHSRGIKVGFYYLPYGKPSDALFGQISGNAHTASDVWLMATNWGIDGLKIDNGNGSDTNTVMFWNLVASTGKPIWRQQSPVGLLTGSDFSLDPLLASGVNSAYVAYGQPDTYNPTSFTNSFQHFLVESHARHFVSPTFKLEGCGWVGQDSTRQYPYPNHCYWDLAIMLCERIMTAPPLAGGFSYTSTNTDVIDLLRDPLIQPFDKAVTNNGNLLMVVSRPLFNGRRALCFINSDNLTNTITVNATDLGFPTNTPITLYSPWFNSIDLWATNTLSVTVPPTNTVLYSAAAGFLFPRFYAGTNYLSDLNWRPDVSIIYGGNEPDAHFALSKDYRNGDPTKPLIINTTTYAKGFCAGYQFGSAPIPKWSYALGGQCQTFQCDFGKEQAWDGGSSGCRLTIWTNSVQAFQSNYVTNNSTQATNVSLSLTGVNFISFQVDTTGTCQAVIGNAQVAVDQYQASRMAGNKW